MIVILQNEFNSSQYTYMEINEWKLKILFV